jgi:hypothetical protein
MATVNTAAASRILDATRAFARYEQECRMYVEQNQEIALKNREIDVPTTWEKIDLRMELLRTMEAAPQGALLEDLLPNLAQKAPNAITLKDLLTLVRIVARQFCMWSWFLRNGH